MNVSLPTPLGEYFEAANTNDADRIAACFAEDAEVIDEKETHVGRVAIRQWAAATRKKYSFRSEVFNVEGDAEHPIVSAHVSGNFPGSPVDLTYRFALSGGEIASLSIA